MATDGIVYNIFEQLADGLVHIHEKPIKHKDIKPSNILLQQTQTESGSWCVTPIIADFGISKPVERDRPTNCTKSTIDFLAPEQISHTESTLKLDIFTLGCCFALTLAVLCETTQGVSRI